MIRSALIALGLSASGFFANGVQAQGMVPTAPALQICGGTRLVLQADETADKVDLNYAAEVVSRRVGKFYSQAANYTHVLDGQVVVSLPEPLLVDVDALSPLLRHTEFKFLTVVEEIETGQDIELEQGQVLVPFKAYPELTAVALEKPVLDGSVVASADVTTGQDDYPAVSFTFTPEGSATFARYTGDHIGETVAIVLRGEVVTAPIIQSAITGGQGIITGGFTNREAVELAAVLQGGVLPFDFTIVRQESVDGSDPSADFCP